MNDCKKLMVVAIELSQMTDDIKAKQTDNSIQEIILGQSLYGLQLSLKTVLLKIQQAIAIEDVDGNS